MNEKHESAASESRPGVTEEQFIAGLDEEARKMYEAGGAIVANSERGLEHIRKWIANEMTGVDLTNMTKEEVRQFIGDLMALDNNLSAFMYMAKTRYQVLLMQANHPESPFNKLLDTLWETAIDAGEIAREEMGLTQPEAE